MEINFFDFLFVFDIFIFTVFCGFMFLLILL